MINERDIKTDFVEREIVKILLEKEMSIAEISKLTSIKRSTLVYHLNNLSAKGIIERNRIEEKVTGRPTMIRLKKDFVEKSNKEIENQKQLNKDVLNFVKSENEADREKIIQKFKTGELISPVYTTLLGLERFGYLKNVYKITKKGETFLKESK